jgi:hypothetical protein
MRVREKYQKKNQNRYILRMRGVAYILPIALEVCTLVKVTAVINSDSCGGCM